MSAAGTTKTEALAKLDRLARKTLVALDNEGRTKALAKRLQSSRVVSLN
ncbi:hypothetical protein JVX98_31320 (plasmid) [Ensifer sp. PDNC004]|nr:hypothetical protein [Ensifer sp. PDNC004]QRY71087.1 hypothetical protein JVX98_31320 [Ensifer sp. PDNC004]